MGIVQDKLLQTDIRPSVIVDCAGLVDSEVAAKRGVTGIMIKGGYKAFKAIKPNIVEQAVDHLLDDFVAVLDKLHTEYSGDGSDATGGFDSWLTANRVRVADSLLGVTDNIMEQSKKQALKKIYSGLRGIAQKNVAEAVPNVGKLAVKYIG